MMMWLGVVVRIIYGVHIIKYRKLFINFLEVTDLQGVQMVFYEVLKKFMML